MALGHALVDRLHGGSVDREHEVADAQPGGFRGTSRHDPAERRVGGVLEAGNRVLVGEHGDDEREDDGEDDVAGGTGNGDDDALPPRGRRQRLAGGAGLDRGHGGGVELRERDVAAERDAVDAVFGSADFALPERGPETDGKGVGAHAEKPRGEEVPELVDQHRDAEEEQHAERGEDVGKNGGEENHDGERRFGFRGTLAPSDALGKEHAD